MRLQAHAYASAPAGVSENSQALRSMTKRADGVFSAIIVRLQTAIIEIAYEPWPLRIEIAKRLADQ
jgi:hypothetical protein